MRSKIRSSNLFQEYTMINTWISPPRRSIKSHSLSDLMGLFNCLPLRNEQLSWDNHPGSGVDVLVGEGGEVSVDVGISVGTSVDVGVSVGVSVSVGDGVDVGVREGGMNAVGVTVGVKVIVGVGLGATARVSAGIAVAEAGMDVGVDVPSILPGARRIAIHPAQ